MDDQRVDEEVVVGGGGGDEMSAPSASGLSV